MTSYIYKNARFSLLREGVIRIEYALEGAFCDNETYFARRNASAKGDFDCKDGVLVITTPKITLTYKGGEFSKETLFAQIHTANVDRIWHYGDTLKNNLKGTLSTLDGVSGRAETPDGILSREGFYIIDDSKKAVYTEGWAKSRDERHLIDLYIFAYGHDYLSALKDFTAVSGKAALPRKYFCGSWYSRWYHFTDREYLRIIDEYKEHDFPIDILVVDMDWHWHDWCASDKKHKTDFGYGHAGGNFGWTGYTFCEERFPNPKEFLKAVHNKGVAVTFSDHPADGIRDNEDTYHEFIRLLHEAGYKESVPDNKELLDSEKHPERLPQIQRHAKALRSGIENYRFNAGSRAYMNAFFNSALKAREEDGVDFWWVDWQQDYIYPEVNGIKGLTHNQWLNELYYKNSEKGGKRGINFSRFGGLGGQRHPGNFSGDTTVSFETLAYEIEMTVTSGNALCFFWSHDIGGFYDPEKPKQAECYARWAQFGALSAALRIHCCGEDCDRRPWLWGEPYCSAIRDAFHLRSRLFPYIYSSAYRSSENSIPLLCPLYMTDAENEECYKHPTEYRFGDAILVSPVIEKGKGKTGKVKTSTWLPAGTWYSFFTNKKYSGECFSEESHTLYTFPLFVAAGQPLVTREYTDRMASSEIKELTVTVYEPDCDGVYKTTLYEDDGISQVKGKENSRITEIKYEKKETSHILTLTPDGKGYAGEAETRDITFVIINEKGKKTISKHNAKVSERTVLKI